MACENCGGPEEEVNHDIYEEGLPAEQPDLDDTEFYRDEGYPEEPDGEQ